MKIMTTVILDSGNVKDQTLIKLQRWAEFIPNGGKIEKKLSPNTYYIYTNAFNNSKNGLLLDFTYKVYKNQIIVPDFPGVALNTVMFTIKENCIPETLGNSLKISATKDGKYIIKLNDYSCYNLLLQTEMSDQDYTNEFIKKKLIPFIPGALNDDEEPFNMSETDLSIDDAFFPAMLNNTRKDFIITCTNGEVIEIVSLIRTLNGQQYFRIYEISHSYPIPEEASIPAFKELYNENFHDLSFEKCIKALKPKETLIKNVEDNFRTIEGETNSYKESLFSISSRREYFDFITKWNLETSLGFLQRQRELIDVNQQIELYLKDIEHFDVLIQSKINSISLLFILIENKKEGSEEDEDHNIIPIVEIDENQYNFIANLQESQFGDFPTELNKLMSIKVKISDLEEIKIKIEQAEQKKKILKKTFHSLEIGTSDDVRRELEYKIFFNENLLRDLGNELKILHQRYCNELSQNEILNLDREINTLSLEVISYLFRNKDYVTPEGYLLAFYENLTAIKSNITHYKWPDKSIVENFCITFEKIIDSTEIQYNPSNNPDNNSIKIPTPTPNQIIERLIKELNTMKTIKICQALLCYLENVSL